MLAAVLALIALALIFDFVNGFRDAPSAIATVVSTRVLAPAFAVAWAAFFNFVAAFGGGVAVANTIGTGLIQLDRLKAQGAALVLAVIFASLLGAIFWNVVTWFWDLPSSSSHALAGGLIGATLAALGPRGLVAGGVVKLALFIVLAPVIAMALGTAVTILMTWIVRRRAPTQVDKWFRRLQLVSSGLFSFSHGANDAQKTMGVVALLLYGTLWADRAFAIPFWLVLLCHAAMGLGTAVGGVRLVRAMGHSLTRLQPIGGFCADTSAGITMLAISRLGIPASTTHTLTGAMAGVGATKGMRAVRWGMAGPILWAWVLTIPATAAVAALIFALTHATLAMIR